MTVAERLIAIAARSYERTGVIPADLHARLLQEGVDAEALINTLQED